MTEKQLVFSVADQWHNRQDAVAGAIINDERLDHTFSMTLSDLDSLPTELTGEAFTSALSQDLSTTQYFRKDKGLLKVSFSARGRYVTVYGFFPEEKVARNVFDEFVKYFPDPTPPDHKVAMNFWNWGGDDQGAGRSIRRMVVPKWDELQNNYSPKVATHLEEVMRLKPSGEHSGKLMLWRGLPGTGKTWALRALCREWREWCAVHYVIDPDVFFAKASYMMGVLTSLDTPDDDDADDDDDDAPRRRGQTKAPKWNLLILEDCGELIGVDSKARTGQALSKLLNLSDGLLGQGINLMVLITTNEDYQALHPAIGRQGRCLSNLSFEPFTIAEATKWLAAHNCEHKVDGKQTLSDLYAYMNERRTIQNEADRKVAGFQVTR
jgi:hypothetical protein